MLRLLLLAAIVFCNFGCQARPSGPVIDNADLRSVVEGWSAGDWAEVYSSFRDAESGAWADTLDESPWDQWDVEVVAPDTVEVVMSDGSRSRITFRDGTYLDFGPAKEDGVFRDPLELPIVEAKVVAVEDWRLLIQWPSPPDDTSGLLSFSELEMAGGAFTWTNWLGQSVDDRRRMSMSISKLTP